MLPGVTAKSVMTANYFCDSFAMPNQKPMTSLVIVNHALMTEPTVRAAVVLVITSIASPALPRTR